MEKLVANRCMWAWVRVMYPSELIDLSHEVELLTGAVAGSCPHICSMPFT